MNRLFKLLCLALFASTLLPAVAAAEETAVNSAVNSLGRLFYTPEQRIQLERLRSRPGETGMTISNTISVNGIVQRRGGGSVVWINGVPQSHESDDGLLAGRNIAPDSAPVKVPGAHKPVRLKVGQSIDINSGAVSNIGTAPATGKDVPARENEQARQAGQADAPLQRPAPGGRVKSAPLTEKDD